MILATEQAYNGQTQLKELASMRVAIIAPPWLRIPPDGYGGIEQVLDALVDGLVKNNVEVELFSIGKTKIKNVKVHFLYKEEQYKHIHKPMYEALPISIAHQTYALDIIRNDGKFDIIHDHNGFIGPLTLSLAAENSIPSSIHTLHGPPFSSFDMLADGQPDNRPMWKYFPKSSKLYYVGISDTLMKNAPEQLNDYILPSVYNAVNVSEFMYSSKKQNYFLTLARFCKDKAQHVAAQFCIELGYSLKMAGTISSIGTPDELSLEIANPLSKYRNSDDFKYYSDKILPLTISSKKIIYIGNIKGRKKLKIIANAKALLFPINWEEPFGMVVIEAMASGTPVVAMNRGAMSEIIDHGKNGFLANSPNEFKEYMQRVNEIDPAACRQSVIDKFSSDVMAKNYIERYQCVISKKSLHI